MISGGFAGKLIRVDLTVGKAKVEDFDEETARRYWGGRGWGGYFLLKELEANIDPFSSKNKIFFLTGPIVGTLTPFSGKFVVVTKSPLTGTFTRAVAGGQWGPELKFAGYDAIIVEGKSPKPAYIFIDGDKVEIRDGTHLWGKTTGQTEIEIKSDLKDSKVQIASIGQAGENRIRFGNIIHESRSASRGGVGSVMGSKNLKAIAVRGKVSVGVADVKRFKKLLVEAYASIRNCPTYAGRIKYGTSGTVSVAHGLGIMPVENYSRGIFEGIDGLVAETMNQKIVVHDESCFACSVPCGKLTHIKKGPYAGAVLQGPQYETIGLLGTNCGISDIEKVAEANYICNEYGMDTISTGNVIAYAIEAYQKGFLTKSDTNGIEMKFGDSELVLNLIHQIGQREGLGDKLAEGVKVFSSDLGKEATKFAMHAKGQEFACFDPRSIVSMGLLYATANTGANHSIGNSFREDMQMKDFLTGKGKAKNIVASQNSYCLLDSAIYCSFSRFTGLDHIPRLQLYTAVTGWSYSQEDFEKQANRIYAVERLFNLREGFEKKDDTLPFRSLEEPMPDGPAKGNVVPLQEMLPEYYSHRGWDESGKPRKKQLVDLGLDEYIHLL